MNNEELKWSVRETRPLLHTPVFDVLTQQEQAAAGPEGSYIALRAPDWVMVIPVLGSDFVMVRQWRHAARCITVEFPGGVCDPGETPAEAAARELLEETGFRAGRLTHLGSCSPNPALFSNSFHCYLADELTATGAQHLDPDELLSYELHPVSEVLQGFGAPPYTHALMGTALAFYLTRQQPRERTAEELWAAAGLEGPVEAWSFGDDPDGLARLVLEGKKRATSSAHPLYALEGAPLPKEGEHSVLLDGRGRALCLVQTTRVRVLPFREVGAEHAALEGEGDLSLEHWRRVHRDFFTREMAAAGLKFTEDMPVVCEELALVDQPR